MILFSRRTIVLLAGLGVYPLFAQGAVTSIEVAHTPIDTTAAGGNLTGHTANDFLIGFDGILGGQQLLITLTAGSIYQNPSGGSAPPAASLISQQPDLAFDSFFALGGLTDISSDVPVFTGGATALVGDGATSGTEVVNQTWFPAGGNFITSGSAFPIARVTLSNDAAGSWRLLSTTSTGHGYVAAPAVGVPQAVSGSLVDLGDGSDGVISEGRLRIAGDASAVRDVQLFYNNSVFDRNGTAVDADDFAAIASDKSPFTYGETSSFENISGYSRGINGLFVDMNGLASRGASLDASDFTISTGLGNFSEAWDTVAIASMGVLPGMGVGGSDRVYLTFADGAIADAWLRLRVEAGTDTGLMADEDFFFGAAPGETGAGLGPNVIGVDAFDLQRISQQLTPLAQSGTLLVTDAEDVNRDRTTNAFDLQVAALNLDFDVFRSITPQRGLPPIAAASVPEPKTALLFVLALLAYLSASRSKG